MNYSINFCYRSVTCMQFNENDNAEPDTPHLYFQASQEGCYNDDIGLDENRHVINYENGCLDNPKVVTVLVQLIQPVFFVFQIKKFN